MTTRRLHEISDDLFALESMLFEVDGEIPDSETEEVIDKWFADLTQERDVKVDNYCALIKNFEASAEARASEAARMAALAQTEANNAKRLKVRLFNFLKAHDIKKLPTLRFKVSRCGNGGQRSVTINEWAETNAVELPERYRVVKYTPDKENFRKDLEVLEQVTMRLEYAKEQNLDADAEDLAVFTELKSIAEWAKLEPRGEHLRIN